MAITTNEYERKFGSSPIFRYSNTGTIAASGKLYYDWEVSANPTAGKYLPFNYLVATNNNTDNPLLIYINGAWDTPVAMLPPKAIRELDSSTIHAFRSVGIQNTGSSTITAGQVELIAQRLPIGSGAMFGALHRQLYSKKPVLNVI